MLSFLLGLFPRGVGQRSHLGFTLDFRKIEAGLGMPARVPLPKGLRARSASIFGPHRRFEARSEEEIPPPAP